MPDGDVVNTKTDGPWWVNRREELLSIATTTSPVIVYDDETINEAFFDLLCIQGLDRLLYSPVHNAHPRIIEKIIRLRAFLKCSSLDELGALTKAYPRVEGERVVLSLVASESSGYSQISKQGIETILAAAGDLKRFEGLSRRLFLYIPLDEGKGGGAPGKGEPLYSLSKATDESLEAISGVEGLAVGVGSKGSFSHDLDFLLDIVTRIRECFHQVAVVILHKCMGIEKSEDSGYPDILGTQKRYQVLTEAFPGIRFWADPEELVIEHVGGLVVTLVDVEKDGPSNFINIPFPPRFLEPLGKKGMLDTIYNLSTEELFKGELVLGDPGSGMGLESSFRVNGEVSKGDVIFIKGVGALGMRLDQIGPLVPVHYLCARRMCTVRL
ncbi:MAG: hypothetical protein JRH08_02820 [Deltaproteobacteria bacterium]|nr:hypothetical protein [Deltaproteobacteria bacterium]MBW1928217.1 hypothetical protein [Deltaproteobacteria bacterium]MBW2024336.1 hypothetical protein [Deltaproteobacteria bacterium]MBW2124633.1 hypothetical protein [Deltaproteobacteria bacterium]